MTDERIVQALATVRDSLVVAIADVERGDHLRACDALDAAYASLLAVVTELKAAA